MNAAESAPRESKGVSKKVFAYCHDSVGIGHLRRTLAICERVGEQNPSASFLIATGTPYVSLFSTASRIDCIKLPALAKGTNGVYDCKYLSMPVDSMMRCRQTLLLDTVEHYAPDLVLVDKAPLGVRRELVPALKWLRQHRPDVRTVFGMRDIEDSAEATIEQWRRDGVYDVLEECYDEIWVYGSRDIFNTAKEYQLPDGVCRKLRYVGHVTRGHCNHAVELRLNRPEVLVTVGGGTDGEFVLEAYLARAAGRVASLGGHSTLVGGPDLPADAARRLRQVARGMDGVDWTDFAECMSCRIRSADLVVSMGGYNTMCEIVGHAKPAVIIPRVRPRLEQAIRARLWALRADLNPLLPTNLTPEKLADQTLARLEQGSSFASPKLDLGGLDRVAARFAEIWNLEDCGAHPVCVQ
ncbi:MAG: glycosyltransferase family protein [Phycisphaerae bacterium]